ncbi:MAG TPA: hypothetical protein PK231_11940 [Acidocella sp.]|nr:MAG: hypothetical protein B7Z77_07985 [Acidocella sp. 20-58-15]HQT40132.1 hypothetical protein [Acidocella sp.]
MKLIIYSYLSNRRSVLGNIPTYNDLFSIFHPIRESRDTSVVSRQCSKSWGEISCQYHALQNVRGYDYVGFESAVRPIFVDFMLPERLLIEFTNIYALREKFARSWHVSHLSIQPDVLKEYEAMRIACDEADTARFMRWLERTDAVVPQFENGSADRFRLTHLDETWELFTGIVRKIGIFQSIPEVFFVSGFWPWYNSYIMRADLFETFADAAFTAFFEFSETYPNLSPYLIRFIFEKLLGVYLRYCAYENALFRQAGVPLLHVLPAEQPVSVPEGFDAEAYLGINIDVAAAGAPADGHYLGHGWREDRNWD